jgi:hypothetical protein
MRSYLEGVKSTESNGAELSVMRLQLSLSLGQKTAVSVYLDVGEAY